MVSDVMTSHRQIEQEERWVIVTGCDKKKVTGNYWEPSIRRGIQNRDLGCWVGSSYLGDISEKKKRLGASQKGMLASGKGVFNIFLPKSLTGLEAKGRSIWVEKTEVRLTVELGPEEVRKNRFSNKNKSLALVTEKKPLSLRLRGKQEDK